MEISFYLKSLAAVVAATAISIAAWSLLPETGLVDDETTSLTNSDPEINQPQRFIYTTLAAAGTYVFFKHLTRPQDYHQKNN